MAPDTIIIGYGNIDRADDGAAFVVINELRRRLGVKPLEVGDTGLDNLQGHDDSIFIPQLTPEIMELFTGYDRMVFVDAHVGPDSEDISSSPVFPHYASSSFTHHMTPSAFLAYLKALYLCEPRAHVVSIRGHEFDFRQTLSRQTQALVQPAVDIILELMDR
jgi:hydrogenase maturation protease